MNDFEWTKERTKAAELLAARNLTVQEIADKVGVSRQALWNWRQDPEFQAEVDSQTEAFRRETRRIGIADKERRLASLNDRWNRLRRVIEARADDPEMQQAAGGDTGLLVKTIKSVGFGLAATIVEEYAVDTGLLREIREHEKQAAIELGQWEQDRPPDDDVHDPHEIPEDDPRYASADRQSDGQGSESSDAAEGSSGSGAGGNG